MRLIRRIGLLLFLALPTVILRPATAASPAVKASPTRLRIAYAAPIGVMAPVWIAAESGALNAESIEAELVLVEARAAIAALIAKEVDALEISIERRKSFY